MVPARCDSRARRDLQCRSADESIGEDLPRKSALRGQAQPDVDTLSEEIVTPPTLPAILKPLVECEAVEEDEDAHEDRVDEVRYGSPAANQVDGDDNPGHRPDNGAHDERSPPRRLSFGRVGHLHEPCLLYTSPSPRDGLLSRMPS